MAECDCDRHARDQLGIVAREAIQPSEPRRADAIDGRRVTCPQRPDIVIAVLEGSLDVVGEEGWQFILDLHQVLGVVPDVRQALRLQLEQRVDAHGTNRLHLPDRLDLRVARQHHASEDEQQYQENGGAERNQNEAARALDEREPKPAQEPVGRDQLSGIGGGVHVDCSSIRDHGRCPIWNAMAFARREVVSCRIQNRPRLAVEKF
jgi:hypothetical protein